MQLSVLQQRIRDKYANQSATVFTNDILTALINDALGAISILEGLPEEQKIVLPFSDLSINATPGASLTLPTDFIKVFRVYSDNLDQDIYPIQSEDIEDFNIADSSRVYYYIVGNIMYFTESINVGNVIISYFKIHDSLVNPTDTTDAFMNGFERIIDYYVMSQVKLSDDADTDSEAYFKKYLIGITNILNRSLTIYRSRTGIDQGAASSLFSLSTIRTKIRNKYSGNQIFNNAHIDSLINDALQKMSILDGMSGVQTYYPLSKSYKYTAPADITSMVVPDRLLKIRKIRSTDLDADIYPYNQENEDNYDLDDTDTVFYYIEENIIYFTKEISSGDVITIHYFEYHEPLTSDIDLIDEFFEPFVSMIEVYVLGWMEEDPQKSAKNLQMFYMQMAALNSKVRNLNVGHPAWNKLDTRSYWQGL